ncbi:methyltransferase domain-containing protein [Roseovarius salis]|uniref:methyltransferase domain-containing protein n=1 Tax=Roseovarius salis TaxID=3376063 RepID=UPI0037CA2488
MRRCIDWYLPEGHQRVIDLGSYDVNGSYRHLLPETVEYTGFDLEPGPGVDVVLEDPYNIPLPDSSVDVVMSGQMLEHCAHFWRVFTEIARVLKTGGLAFVNAPSAGPIHRYPVDCYRFYPDAFQALADWAGLRLVHCWLDERGPWRDLVGVFQKDGSLQPLTAPPEPKPVPLRNTPNPDPAAEIMAGQRPYLDVLGELHALQDPSLYVEIGVRRGNSLRVCNCRMIGIDPDPAVEDAPEALSLYACTSDDFFFFHARQQIDRPVDMAFIDGMHLVEFVCRDFMNLERNMSDDGVIVVDDVLPNHPLQAARDRQTRVWCGDVWRIVPFLRQKRPDLKLTLLDTAPSGLLVITRLNPSDRRLWNNYNPAIRQLLDKTPPPPEAVLSRTEAVAPTPDNIRDAITA